MKKALFVINTMGQAGAEMAMMAMISAMHRDGWQIDVLPIIPQGEMYKVLPEYVRVLGKKGDPESVHSAKGRRKMFRRTVAALLRKGFRRIPYLFRCCRAQRKRGKVSFPVLLWRVLADAAPKTSQSYDLAVAYLEGGATYYVADYCNAPVKVAFVHTDYTKAGYVPSLDAASYDQMQRIFLVSNAALREFLHHFPQYEGKAALFRNMLDQERILRLKEEPGFTDPYDGIRLLSVGRLMYPKAYDVALEACSILKDRGIPIRWYVIGTGELKEALLHQREKLCLEEQFLFLGAKENPYPFVAQCDIFMQTTRWEGRSIALYEAQALCRPVIVSDCEGNLEQVENGVNGLVTSLEPERIADAVTLLVQNPAMRRQFSHWLSKANLFEDNDLPLLYALVDSHG